MTRPSDHYGLLIAMSHDAAFSLVQQKSQGVDWILTSCAAGMGILWWHTVLQVSSVMLRTID
jgi:hypothetical protein